MPTHEVQYGDPEKDQIKSSSSELKELREMAAWQDIKGHFLEVAQEHRKRLRREGVSQRDADFSRGALAIIHDLTNEDENILDLLIELAEQIEEETDGRQHRQR